MPRPDDSDLIERFTDAIANGHPVSTAATMAGFAGYTANEWIALGEAELEQVPTDVYHGRYDEAGSHVPFVLAYKQALAVFCDANLRVIGAATQGKNGWLPAMTLLERRMPGDFGRRTEVSVQQRSVNVHVTAQLSEGTLLKLMALAAEELRPSLPAPQT
jgi:hypothetical protein